MRMRISLHPPPTGTKLSPDRYGIGTEPPSGPENRLHASRGVPSVVRVANQTRSRPLIY